MTDQALAPAAVRQLIFEPLTRQSPAPDQVVVGTLFLTLNDRRGPLPVTPMPSDP